MKTKTKATTAPLPPLQQGQKWEMQDSNIQISLVGKRLVHYKFFKGQLKRASISITSIRALEEFLTLNKALLTVAPTERKAST